MIHRTLKYLTRKDTEADKKRYDSVYDNLRDLDKNQLSNLIGLQTVDLFQRPLFIKYYSLYIIITSIKDISINLLATSISDNKSKR